MIPTSSQLTGTELLKFKRCIFVNRTPVAVVVEWAQELEKGKMLTRLSKPSHLFSFLEKFQTVIHFPVIENNVLPFLSS